MKIQVLCMELQIHFSLMQPLCQISKKLYGKSTPYYNLSTALRDQTSQKHIRHIVQSTLVRNSIINIHLPLMIFIRMHSQESQFHNKCLFFSIMSIIYVQIATFVRICLQNVLSHEARSLGADKISKSSITVHRNMSNDVQNQSLGSFNINLQ